MKTPKMFLAAALAAIITIASCDNEDPIPTPKVPLKILSAAITKVTGSEWEAGDAIVVILDGKTYTYATSAGDGMFASEDEANTAYLPTDGSDATVSSYYPAAATLTNGKVAINTADQSAVLPFLVASDVTANADAPSVALAFAHKLALVNIAISPDTESGATVDLSGASVSVNGTSPSAAWDVAAATLTDLADAANIAIPTSTDGDGILRGTAILIPATSGVEFLITLVDGNKFIATLEEELAPGTANDLDVTLSKNAAVIQATVTPWTEGVDAQLLSVKLDEGITDETSAGINAIQLWKTSNEASKATYTFDEGVWSSETPFYIDALDYNDYFMARYTPASIETGQVPDILGTLSAASVGKSALRLEMHHLMASVSVNITKTDEFKGSIAGATLNIGKELYTGYAINDNNSVSLDASAPKQSYTSLTDGASFIAVPQSLGNVKLTITLANGNQYSTSKSINLESGKHTALNFTFDESRISLALSVADWTKENIDSNINVN